LNRSGLFIAEAGEDLHEFPGQAEIEQAPKAAAAAGGGTGAAKAGGKEEDFGDFPDALDGEDDDLPF
jgi:hypothetical protein